MKKSTVLVSLLSLGVIGGLVALAIAPLLPRVQVAVGGAVDTEPVVVEEFMARTDMDDFSRGDMNHISHEDVDAEYAEAASIWPWELPPGWKFSASRGVADTPGDHWQGMGVRAAFSAWSWAALKAVENEQVTGADANALLDDVEESYRVLYDTGLLTNPHFVEKSVTPLRPE